MKGNLLFAGMVILIGGIVFSASINNYIPAIVGFIIFIYLNRRGGN